MGALEPLLEGLYSLPGRVRLSSEGLLRRGAQAHLMLLERAAAEAGEGPSGVGPLFRSIATLLRQERLAAIRDRFLLDPTFIEGLHTAANDSPALFAWHRQIADPSVARVWGAPTNECASSLGNSLLTLLLCENPGWENPGCDDPGWQGTIRLRTDYFGRLRFPLSGWSVALWSRADGPDGVLSQRSVDCRMARDSVQLSIADDVSEPFLVIPRREWLRMLVVDDDSIDGRAIQWPAAGIGARLQRATAIPGWNVTYDPVSPESSPGHAALTGGLVATVLNGIAGCSPAIAAEFNALEATVRGWELASGEFGTLQSFSDPTAPRVMGINVTYSADDAPRLCPYCFTWFGHELGHTKSYLLETILHVEGESLLARHGEYTETMPRYGRALPVRTLLQVPYTHLYEWMLVMDFAEGDQSLLPWDLGTGWIEFGDDIHREIDEAFACIDRKVPLAPAGRALVSRMRQLYEEVSARWRRLSKRAGAAPESSGTLPQNRLSRIVDPVRV